MSCLISESEQPRVRRAHRISCRRPDSSEGIPKLVRPNRLQSGVVVGQLDGLVDHHADEIGSAGLAGPLGSNESDRCPLTSKQTEKTRYECLRGEAPRVLSG